MVLLFVLFPRIAPLWGVPTEAIGKTGLSNQLEFGAMNEIANDESIAMRLKFDGPPPPPDQRYFRGPVLTRFDGKTWRAPDPRASQSWLRGRDELIHRDDLVLATDHGGLTEFLPISSTGHLILLGELLGFQGPPGKVFEISIQLGAILAVIVVFWRKLLDVALGMWKPRTPERYFAVNIGLAFLPAMVIGAT
eukprot:gene13880-16960_t